MRTTLEKFVRKISNTPRKLADEVSERGSKAREAIRSNVGRMVEEVMNAIKKEGPQSNEFAEDPILLQERFEPPEWNRPVADQLHTLKSLLPGLEEDASYVAQRLKEGSPENTQKVVIPKLSALSKTTGVEDPYAQIGDLIEQACEFLENQREGRFTHYRKNELGPDRVQVVQEIAEQRKLLEEQIPGDIMVLDVDSGNTYAGWTPRRARVESVVKEGQIALSSVDIAWMLLLNPGRLQNNTDLSMDSAMERYLSNDRGWVTVLFFYHRGGRLEFGYRWDRRAYFDSGAAIAKT